MSETRQFQMRPWPTQHLCLCLLTGVNEPDAPVSLHCQSVQAGQVRGGRCLCHTAEIFAGEFSSAPPNVLFLPGLLCKRKARGAFSVVNYSRPFLTPSSCILHPPQERFRDALPASFIFLLLYSCATWLMRENGAIRVFVLHSSGGLLLVL